uniref:Uncharacterized protein n=1 Tax=Aegilops tauschii TaxID=37682 RepID=R7WAP2_AEGTA
MVDPEPDPSAAHDAHALPNLGSGEFKHFIRRLPKFMFCPSIRPVDNRPDARGPLSQGLPQ